MGLRQGDPLVLETPCLLDKGSGLTEQAGMAREAKDHIRPALGSDDVDDLWRRNMTIAPDQHVGVGPVAPQRRQQPHQEHRIVGSGRAGTRTQVGRDEGMRRPCENEERQIAMVLIGVIREGKLLLAMGGVIRVIQSEHNSRWWLRVTRAEMVYEGSSEPVQVCAVSTVF